MALEQRPYTRTAESVGIDAGLRAYMLKVYNYMTTALLLTGLVAFFFGKASIVTNDLGQIVALTGMGNALFNSSFEILLLLNNSCISLFISYIDSLVLVEFTEPPPINKGGFVFHWIFDPNPYE